MSELKFLRNAEKGKGVGNTRKIIKFVRSSAISKCYLRIPRFDFLLSDLSCDRDR